MSSKYEYLLKNTSILALSNFASKILVFLLVPIYTSVLSTKEFGTYDLILSTILMLYPVLTVNISDSVMRFLLDKNRKEKQIAVIGMKLTAVSCGLALLVLLVLRQGEIFPAIHGLEVYIFLYYLFYVFNQLFIQFAKGMERVIDMAVASVMSIVIMLMSNILFLLVFRLGLKGFFAANILAQSVPVLYFIIRLKFWRYQLEQKMDTMLLREMLRYSVPLIATGIAWSINSSADKYVVTIIEGVSSNGLLAAAYKIPAILNVLQGIFIQAWHISGVKEYGSEDACNFYGQVFLMMNLLMCTGCSLLILLAKPLGYLLYSKDFFASWQFVPFLLISSVLNCASGILGPLLSAQKNSKDMAVSAVAGIIINLTLNVLLVYLMGIQGVTIATAVSSLVIYIIRKRAVRKMMSIRYYWRVPVTWVLLTTQASVAIWLASWRLELLIMAIFVLINLPLLVDIWKRAMNAVKQVHSV